METELTAYCPHCKAIQSVWFHNDIFEPTRKFSFDGKYVWHNCGSTKPCKLRGHRIELKHYVYKEQ